MAKEKLPFCVGFVDGTHIQLAKAPTDDPVSYFNRKGFYSFNLQLVVDPSKQIRAYHVEQPGKVHDSKVFSLMNICKEPVKYFNEHEYLIGDQAYRLTNTTITPYRRSQKLTKDHERFNYHISSKRIAVEHANGVLKSRFQSLTGLRIKVDRARGHEFACQWITACLILYNLLLDRDPWPLEKLQEQSNENTNDECHEEDEGARSKRDSLLKHVLYE